MKKKLLEALQAKFSGVEANVLEPTVNRLLKTTTKEEEITTAVEGVTFQQIVESYGDSRSTQAAETASKRAITSYEKQHKLKDGKPLEDTGDGDGKKVDPDKKPNDDDNIPVWAKKLLDKQEQLENRFKEEDEAKVQKDLNSSLVTLLKENGVRESFYSPVIKGRTFKDEEEMRTYAESVIKSFADDEQSVANAKHQPSTPPHQTNIDGNEEEDPLLKNVETKTTELADKK